MFKIEQYIKVQTLNEAYELNQKKSATVLGGCGWLKMGNRFIQTAIDLSNLGFDKIEETPTEFKIGCMVSLRQIETNKELIAYFGNTIKECFCHIVGVQFRNCATIGGSIWQRFGFSDPLTLFLSLDSKVQLFNKGIVDLCEFINMPYDKDILTHIIIPKKKQKVHYITHRLSETDFPVIACAVSMTECDKNKFRVCVGARPQRAKLVLDEKGILNDGITENSAKEFSKYTANCLTFSSNMRASAKFRKHLTNVLVRRALLNINQEV